MDATAADCFARAALSAGFWRSISTASRYSADPRRSLIGRNWVPVATTFFLVLGLTQVYGAVSGLMHVGQAMLLTLVGDLSTLAETVVLLLLFVFISTNVAVLVLRRDTVDHPHFRVWTAVPVLGVASCLLLLTQQSAKVWLFAAILLVVGAVLFLVTRRVRASQVFSDHTA